MDTNETELMMTRKVTVIDRLQDTYQWYRGGFGAYSVPLRTITLDWEGRGEPVLTPYHEDGETFHVHNWHRDDGKVDCYADVLNEAEVNGLNQDLQEERETYRQWLSEHGHLQRQEQAGPDSVVRKSAGISMGG